MTAIDFLVYCLGVSSVVVSSGFSVWLIVGRIIQRAFREPPFEPTEQRHEIDDLGRRLQAFQDARFASPLVRQQLDPDFTEPLQALPARRFIPRVKAQRPVNPPTKKQVQPQATPTKDNKDAERKG